MKKAIFAATSASLFLLSGIALAQSGPDLAKSKNCMNCHDLEKKKVGPADRKSTRLNSSHSQQSRMPSSA